MPGARTQLALPRGGTTPAAHRDGRNERSGHRYSGRVSQEPVAACATIAEVPSPKRSRGRRREGGRRAPSRRRARRGWSGPRVRPAQRRRGEHHRGVTLVYRGVGERSWVALSLKVQLRLARRTGRSPCEHVFLLSGGKSSGPKPSPGGPAPRGLGPPLPPPGRPLLRDGGDEER